MLAPPQLRQLEQESTAHTLAFFHRLRTAHATGSSCTSEEAFCACRISSADKGNRRKFPKAAGNGTPSCRRRRTKLRSTAKNARKGTWRSEKLIVLSRGCYLKLPTTGLGNGQQKTCRWSDPLLPVSSDVVAQKQEKLNH